MDEYIKREDALDAVLFALVGTGHQSRAIEAIRDVPTADVAPKSEVHDDHHKQVACYTLGCREGDKIKREVAREIFEEIYSIFRKQYELCSKTDFKLLEPILQAERFTINEMWDKVAKLKKKYTEENK